MENSPFGLLFGNTSTTATHIDEPPPPPPPAQLGPFKISMKIVERVMDNCYSGDGTVHPGDHLFDRPNNKKMERGNGKVNFLSSGCGRSFENKNTKS
jgi:hypothetical protein